VTKNRRTLYLCFGVYFFIVLTIAVFPPIVNLWNKIDPHILSLPFSQATVIFIACLLIVGLLSWFLLEGVLNAREKAKRLKGEPLDY